MKKCSSWLLARISKEMRGQQNVKSICEGFNFGICILIIIIIIIIIINPLAPEFPFKF